MSPRSLKSGAGSSKSASGHQNDVQEAPEYLEMYPRLQDQPQEAQERRQEGKKISSRRPQEADNGPQEALTKTQKAPRRPNSMQMSMFESLRSA